MDFHILFDKIPQNKKFKAGWGFSLFVKGVLFDTGEDKDTLANNLKEKNISPGLIQEVVISHGHWDHLGGLEYVLSLKNNLKVYGGCDLPRDLKDKIAAAGSFYVPVTDFVKIKNNFYLSGPISGFYKEKAVKEQALIVKTKKGLAVITGCSHPGIVKIIEKVKSFFPGDKISLILGGMHLISSQNREIKAIAEKLNQLSQGNAYVGPAHCAGYQATQIFKKIFQDKFIETKAGKTITL